jgi:hypothetical protein
VSSVSVFLGILREILSSLFNIFLVMRMEMLISKTYVAG